MATQQRKGLAVPTHVYCVPPHLTLEYIIARVLTACNPLLPLCLSRLPPHYSVCLTHTGCPAASLP